MLTTRDALPIKIKPQNQRANNKTSVMQKQCVGERHKSKYAFRVNVIINIQQLLKITSADFFSICVFSHEHSRFTGLQGKVGTSLTPFYHFHPLHRNLDTDQVITAEIPPLHISRLAVGLDPGIFWFLSASRWTLSYVTYLRRTLIATNSTILTKWLKE